MTQGKGSTRRPSHISNAEYDRRWEQTFGNVDNVSRAALCGRCGQPRFRTSGRYCFDCHAAYMREWRKTHKLNPDQQKRDNARSYAGVYKRRGLIRELPCEVCGEKAQMHHEDYDKPTEVRWLCRYHHLELHQEIVEHAKTR